MLDCVISLADHSESRKEFCTLEWKQIPLLGVVYNFIIQLPISPLSYNIAWKRRSPTPNMLKLKGRQELNKKRKFPLSIASVGIVCQRNPAFDLLWLQITTTASVVDFPVLLDTDNSQKNNFMVARAFYVLNYSGEMHS